MKLNPPQKLKDIAAIINAKFEGDADHVITGLNELNKVEKGDIVFVDHPKYYDKALASAATTIIINKKVETPKGKARLSFLMRELTLGSRSTQYESEYTN